MNKPIIIDGVDVSECAYMYDNEDFNYMCQDGIGTCICRDNKNCYYKQLHRLEAENEELKRKNTILELVTEPQRQEIEKYHDKALKLKQALEEIKRLLTIAMDEETVSYLHFELIEKSIKEINEVLK